MGWDARCERPFLAAGGEAYAGRRDGEKGSDDDPEPAANNYPPVAPLQGAGSSERGDRRVHDGVHARVFKELRGHCSLTAVCVGLRSGALWAARLFFARNLSASTGAPPPKRSVVLAVVHPGASASSYLSSDFGSQSVPNVPSAVRGSKERKKTDTPFCHPKLFLLFPKAKSSPLSLRGS